MVYHFFGEVASFVSLNYALNNLGTGEGYARSVAAVTDVQQNVGMMLHGANNWKIVDALWSQATSEIFPVRVWALYFFELEISFVILSEQVDSFLIYESFIMASKVHQTYDSMFSRS